MGDVHQYINPLIRARERMGDVHQYINPLIRARGKGSKAQRHKVNRLKAEKPNIEHRTSNIEKKKSLKQERKTAKRLNR